MLVDHILQPIQPLHDPDSVPSFVAFQLSLRYGHGHFDVDVGDVISDPSDIEQADDVGHAAQDHACGHQSFGFPGASHADIPPCSPHYPAEPEDGAPVARRSSPGVLKLLERTSMPDPEA